MKKYLNQNGVMVIVIAIIIAGITVVSMNVSGSPGIFSNVVGALTKPIKSASTAVIRSFESLYGYMYKYDELQAENTQLKMQVAQLQREAREYAEISEENNRLHDAMGLQRRHTDFQLVPATVIGRGASNFDSSFSISKGSENSDVEVGDCIVTEDGMLVGRVIEVNSSTSTAITIIDTTFTAGVSITSSGDSAVVSGDFNLMRQGKLKLDFLTTETSVIENDTIITSGRGGSFPKGLVLGSVDQVSSNPGGLGRSASITPAADLDNLMYVYIVTDYEITE